MERPTMDLACMNRCEKGGGSRSACHKKCYPEGSSNRKSGSKKKGGRKPARSSRY